MKIKVNNSYTYTDFRNGCEDWRSALFIEFHSLTDIAEFGIVMRNFTVSYVIELDVTADVSGSCRMEVQYASSRMGLLQSTRWHPKAGILHHITGQEENSWQNTVTIPPHHTLLLSIFFFFHASAECVTLRVNGLSGQRHVTGMCGQTADEPTFLVEEGVLTAEFRLGQYAKSMPTKPFPGYRFLFTIYQESAITPILLPGGKWNCTDKNWKGLHGLKPHLACNVKTQCDDGRDEEGCGYTTCQNVGFEVGGRCYFLGWKRHASHRQADWLCQKQGARLASLTRPERIGEIIKILWRRHPFHVKIGLAASNVELPPMFRKTLIWMDNTLAYALDIRIGYGEYFTLQGNKCGFLGAHYKKDEQTHHSVYLWTVTIITLDCLIDGYRHSHFLCDLSSFSNESLTVKSAILDPQNATFGSQLISCPNGHWVHSFVACDPGSSCWALTSAQYRADSSSWEIPIFASCPIPDLASLPPSFQCLMGSAHVPYTFVCDHRQDCGDNSDESFCDFPHCRGHKAQQCGSLKQCYAGNQFCDGQVDCVNEDDESDCTFSNELDYSHRRAPPPPAVIDFVKNGTTIFTPLKTEAGGQPQPSMICPETHYQCAHDGYCLPTFTRCNDLYDCTDHEDEADCDTYACPGHFRCFDSKICLHPQQVCDGIHQCPRSDDELLCDAYCPQSCTCHGLAFTCAQPFPVSRHPELRYLNVRSSGMTLSEMAENTMLVYLSLADCRLQTVAGVTLPNLITLDLSHNNLVAVPFTAMLNIPNLRTLFLSDNPVSQFLAKDINMTQTFPQMHVLDLSLIPVSTLDHQFVQLFPQVRALNLSQCRTQRVTGPGFQPLVKLQTLDMTGCPMTGIDQELLQGVTQLQTVYSDNYKLCCAASLVTDTIDCQAPQDEISSCQDLLRSNLYRVMLGVFNSLALLGNGVSFIFRLSSLRGSGSPGFSVFVLHLCLSDFLMGVYLTLIGLADRLYQDVYVWRDTAWRHSVTCKIAGFLSLISCEVSAFIICLITLDRFLVVRFPLSFLHFKGWTAQLACCISWVVGFLLSVVPLLPSTAHWQFYSQTGICIPLPVTRKQFAGHSYSFGIMIVLNFVLFIVIAVGQAAIYLSIRSNTMKGGQSTQRSQDNSIARRLFTVAMSDFFCWFPIGLLGLLASLGVPVSGEVNVIIAIIVMPLNSALNPFLYTLNLMLQKRERKKEEQLLKWLESQK